jgi:hypothetical protein
MARLSTVEPYNSGRSALASAPNVPVAVLALIAAVPGFVVIWLMSVPLLLPAFSLA